MVVAVFPAEGERVVQEQLLTMFDAMIWGLFTNDFTPDKTSQFPSSFTEATFSGYGRVVISWSDIFMDLFDRAYRDGPIVQFQHDGGPFSDTVYGFFVIEAVSSRILWAARFPAPKVMNAITSVIQLSPRVLVGDLAPP